MPAVLAIAAHPDDIEFLMAGTLLRLGERGWELHYLNVANGCCGSTRTDAAETARTRRGESQAAARELGATHHDSLCDDLEIFYERETLRRLAAVVRSVAPRIVLTHALADYMEDHTNTARLAVTAAFARGMPNFPVQPPVPAVAAPVTVYHAQPYTHRDPLGRPVRPELCVDVTDLQDRKSAALACHASQKQWLDESQGVDSYLQALRRLDREAGEMSGRFGAAEGWRRHLAIGFCNEGDDPLSDALGERAVRLEADPPPPAGS